MDVREVIKLKKQLDFKIQTLIRDFDRLTGTEVAKIDIVRTYISSEDGPKMPIGIEVETTVELPE